MCGSLYMYVIPLLLAGKTSIEKRGLRASSVALHWRLMSAVAHSYFLIFFAGEKSLSYTLPLPVFLLIWFSSTFLKGSRTERLQLVNAVRGSNRPCAPHFLELDPKDEDMEFDLIELEQIPVGEPFALVVTILVKKITSYGWKYLKTYERRRKYEKLMLFFYPVKLWLVIVMIKSNKRKWTINIVLTEISFFILTQNKSSEPRTVQADLSSESMYYTGVRANVVKKASGKFVVGPNASKFVTNKLPKLKKKQSSSKGEPENTLEWNQVRQTFMSV